MKPASAAQSRRRCLAFAPVVMQDDLASFVDISENVFNSSNCQSSWSYRGLDTEQRTELWLNLPQSPAEQG